MDTKGISSYPKKGLQIGALLGFLDETGFSDRPTVRKTWAPKGKTPIVTIAGGWKNKTLIGTIVTDPLGKKPAKFYGMIPPASVHANDCIVYLKYLKRHLKDKKLIILWDGLSAHTAKVTQAYIASQKDWLTVVRTPTYAPEVNPPEYLWAAMKTKDCSNTESANTEELEEHIRRSIHRVKRNPTLLRGCLNGSGLFDKLV